MVEDEPVDFVKKLEELRRKKGNLPPAPPKPTLPESTSWENSSDLLPDLGGPELTEGQVELDSFVENIDIIDAYKRWCGKMTPETKGKRESIMISCPNPSHPDSNPSAWINLDKQTYFCSGCQEGGDIHDIAALNMGYPVPGYKDGETFSRLRRDMAESFGFRSKKVSGGEVNWIEEVSEPETSTDNPERSLDPPTSKSAPETGVEGVSSGEVAHMWAEDDESDELVIYPTIKWRNLIAEDTFLHEYMKACSNDDSPEEYHFWHGLMALGLVVGRNVTLDDTRPVYGNLLVCIMGATGTGKSRSRGHLNRVLLDTSPYKEDGTKTTGVKQVPVPGSGEHLVSQFAYEGRDPTNNKISLGMQRVTGIVDFDEMAALLSRANRQGSILKTTIMGLADAVSDVRIGSLTRGDFIAFEPFCSITASTQPKAVRSTLSHDDTGSGFLNRWIFAGGKQKQIEILGGDRSSIRIDLSSATEKLKNVRGWGAIERSLRMDDDAYELYAEFFRREIEPMKNKDQTDLLKRIDLISKKLMLLLTINLRLDTVPVSAVQAMIDIVGYVVECYGVLNSNIGVTRMSDAMDEIKRHILRHKNRTGRGASARDIVKYTKGRNYDLEQIKKALDTMTALDIIELEPKPPGPGRPSIRYRVTGEQA